MWKRNLLFVGLVVGGVLTLGYNLMPARTPRPATRHDAAAYQAPDLLSAVARVDESFRAEWAEKKLTPAPPADDLAVARRLALGLMGTVPSLQEVRQFEYLPQAERLPWWIDHVLKDPRFADYFAERLARAYVGTEDGPFILYRRRRFVNWLSEQLAANRPYDKVAYDVITATGLWTNQPATNFTTVTRKEDGPPDPVRLAGRVTRAFLGLRLDCAECHNHPYKHWKQKDFQGFSAFFGQTRIGLKGVYEDPKEDYHVITDPEKKTTAVVPPSVPFSPELVPPVGTRRQRLAGWVTSAKNPYFARAIVNRVWALMTGRPLNDPVDNLEAETVVPKALDALTKDFVEHGFDLRWLIRTIASTQAYRLDSAAPDRELTEADEEAWAAFPLTRLRPEQVAGGVLQASSVTTINADSHIFVRLARLTGQKGFLDRYGDNGEDEFSGRGGTIPQRLLLMNGELTRERIKEDLFTASSRIASQAPDDARAVEAAYLTVLTRRPTPAEAAHFIEFLSAPDPVPDRRLVPKAGKKPGQKPDGDVAEVEPGPLGRGARMEDVFWALINSTEFSWNH